MLPLATYARAVAVAVTCVASVAVPTTASSAAPSEATGLRSLADDASFALGAAVDVAALDDAAYVQLLTDNVNVVSTRDDLSVAVVQPEPGTFDFSRAEAIVDFAVEHDMTVRGHDLVTADQLPAWLRDGSWDAAALEEVLREHVTAVVTHFEDRNPGVISQWDVVGRALLPDGTRRPSVWQQVIGDRWVDIAFEAARAATPSAQLFYDDFYDDVSITQDAALSGVAVAPGATAARTTCDAVPKCVGAQQLVAGLLEAGAPIDGVGLQAQLFSPDPLEFGAFSAWIEDLDLDWAVTEFDVPLPATEVGNADILEFQAAVYGGALDACAASARCDTFVTWGVTDRLSPIPQDTGGAFGGALWFDVDDAPKPAFDAMAQVLGGLTTTVMASVPASTEPPPPVTATVAPTVEVDAPENDSSLVPALVVGGIALAAVALIVVLARRRPRTDPDP